MREAMLIVHFIGLVMGLGTGFANAFLGVAAAKMRPEDATKFRLNVLALGKMGHIGLALLIVSGLYLITPYWKILSATPLLMLKLALVITLGALIGRMGTLAKKAKAGDAEVQFKKMEKLGKLTMLVALSIVVVAILVFH